MTLPRRFARRVAALALATGALGLAACTTAPGPAATPLPAVASPGPTLGATAQPSWTTYHADGARTGAVPGPESVPATRAWTARLGAKVYGQPLVADGRVLAAAENDRVVALDPATGRTIWSRTIGTPLTRVASVAGCGNIDPLGITSTPVADVRRHVVYVVGEVALPHGEVEHRLVGLDTRTGRVVLSRSADPPLPAGERAVHLLQRAGLALANGRVYVAYGGNSGDCGRYHGWVVGLPQQGSGPVRSFEVAPDGEGGAIWLSGGAPAIDAAGDVSVTTGNANPDPPEGGPDPKRYTESVVKLSPDLQPLASFKDRTAGGDEDLATGNPVLLPRGRLFAVGKTRIGFVLRTSDLHLVAAIPGVCGSAPDGGPAFDASTGRIVVPCRDGGLQTVDLRAMRVGPLLPGANSGPILVGRTLWAAAYPAGTLTAYDATTGAVRQTLHAGPVPSFATPTAAAGLLLIGTDTGVTAWRGP